MANQPGPSELKDNTVVWGRVHGEPASPLLPRDGPEVRALTAAQGFEQRSLLCQEPRSSHTDWEETIKSHQRPHDKMI